MVGVALAAPQVGQAFLGAQGDPWDTHRGMLLALLGAIVTVPLIATAHDGSMAKVPPTSITS